MDYEITPFGKESSVSGHKFDDGDTVHCFLIAGENGELLREDIDEADINELDASRVILGRWTRIFEEKPNVREDNLNHQRSLEELFLSLFEIEAAVESEESDALKQIVGLMLERKRLVRRKGTAEKAGDVRYIHVSSKNTYDVPGHEVTPQLVMKIQQQLVALVR